MKDGINKIRRIKRKILGSSIQINCLMLPISRILMLGVSMRVQIKKIGARICSMDVLVGHNEVSELRGDKFINYIPKYIYNYI